MVGVHLSSSDGATRRVAGQACSPGGEGLPLGITTVEPCLLGLGLGENGERDGFFRTFDAGDVSDHGTHPQVTPVGAQPLDGAPVLALGVVADPAEYSVGA